MLKTTLAGAYGNRRESMQLRGINRVVIAVHDIEKSKEFYSKLLGATFHDANWTGESFGINVAISWDAGLELCAPMPGRENDSAVSPFLEKNGEGVVNVFFGVSDAGAAKEQAAKAGIETIHSLDFTQEEIDEHLGGLFRKYEEHTLNSAERCGFAMTLAQIDAK
jgi:catechol 2,3-dioxygenase-like lactoylglutathione lyase family enzyme